MARTWLSVTVELLNDAFARWDRAHLSLFTLADGRIVTDEDTGAEMAGAPSGPLLTPLEIQAAKVARTVELGAEFQFTFLGDDAPLRRHRSAAGPSLRVSRRRGHPRRRGEVAVRPHVHLRWT